jgi:hypothetical protein
MCTLTEIYLMSRGLSLSSPPTPLHSDLMYPPRDSCLVTVEWVTPCAQDAFTGELRNVDTDEIESSACEEVATAESLAHRLIIIDCRQL